MIVGIMAETCSKTWYLNTYVYKELLKDNCVLFADLRIHSEMYKHQFNTRRPDISFRQCSLGYSE